MSIRKVKLVLNGSTDQYDESSIKNDWLRVSDRLDWSTIVSCVDLAEKKNNLGKYAILISKNDKKTDFQIFPYSSKKKYTNRGELASKVALLFPGIGDHYADMVSSLYPHFDCYRKNIDKCFTVLKKNYQIDFYWLLNSKNTLQKNIENFKANDILRGAKEKSYNSGLLFETRLAHPFVFCHEIALAYQLLHWGMHPAVVVGYSLGEYAAATIASDIELEQVLDWVVKRAQQVNLLEKKAMLAISATQEQCSQYFSESIKTVAVNSPINLVVAGEDEPVRELRTHLKSQSISAMPVEVSHAFHTTFMEPVRKWAESHMIFQTDHSLHIDMITTTDVKLRSRTLKPKYWLEQLIKTVNFQATADLLADNAQHFIEVGGGSALMTILKQSKRFDRGTWPFMHVLQSSRNRGEDGTVYFLKAIANLWAEGLLSLDNIPKQSDID